MLHRRKAVACAHVAILVPRLGEVGEDGRVQPLGQRMDTPEEIVRDGVDRVRRERRDDAPVLTPALDVLRRVRAGRLDVETLRSRQVEDGLTKHPAHAHRVGFLGDDVLVEVHVADGGDAGPRQLGDAEPAAPAHGLGLDETALGRPDVALEPDLQRQVVGEPAK